MLKTKKINKFIKLSTLPASLILGSIITSCTPIPIINSDYKLNKVDKNNNIGNDKIGNEDLAANPDPIENDPTAEFNHITSNSTSDNNDVIDDSVYSNSGGEINSSASTNVNLNNKSYVNDEKWFKQLNTNDVIFVDGSTTTKRFYPRNDKVNTKEYETDLLQRYGDKGFKYPAWNFNYESGRNAILTVTPANGNTPPENLNVSTAVFEETVPTKYTKGKAGIYFNNADWIKEQIRNNKLMQHPAAKNWYQTMP
ncbi:hypothetical protein, partial [Mycoplasma bradburyae]|uniref:hypothetical protein n=1 Tax=Mycoplasma bradburyae TaxID=2963128 RepID=UPI002340758E